MDTRDPISQKYFNQAGITLKVDSSVDAEEFDIFNNLDLLARLTGAPDDSCIIASLGGQDRFNLEVKNDLFKYPSKYVIVNTEKGLVSSWRSIRYIYGKSFKTKVLAPGRSY